MNKFLVAFDKCKGSLTAHELCNLAENVLLERFPESEIYKVPLTDGGEGFAQILTEAGKGKIHQIQVGDSLGREKKAHFGICEIPSLNERVIKYLNLPDQGKLAIIEMAEAVGLADVPVDQRNPWETSTYGVGQMLKAAVEHGADIILLGIGGSSTNDAGMGALAALGTTFFTQQGEPVSFPCPSSWTSIVDVNFDQLVNLPPVRIACDVDNVLLGQNGATACYGPQKGLAEEQIDQFEQEIRNLLTSLSSTFPDVFEKSKVNGSGAAGGMGYGLSLAYDVSLVQGFNLVSDWFGIDEQIHDATLVITGEGRFDKTSLSGKGPFEILRLADGKNTHSLVMAGSVDEESAGEVSKKFRFCDVVAFGRKDWTLEKNLSLAEEQFTKTLLEYNFPDLGKTL